MSEKIVSVNKAVVLLFRFLRLFGIDRFILLDVSYKQIKGKIGWPNKFNDPDYIAEEEVQEIEWLIERSPINEDGLVIAERALDGGKLNGDKFLISKTELGAFAPIHWQKPRVEKALEDLFAIRVYMIDEGEKTDYFFLHC